MSRRKVFGTRTYAKHDAFAAMLNSSPAVSKTQPNITIHEERLPEEKHRTDTKQKSTILQEVCNNAVCTPIVPGFKRKPQASPRASKAASQVESQARSEAENNRPKHHEKEHGRSASARQPKHSHIPPPSPATKHEQVLRNARRTEEEKSSVVKSRRICQIPNQIHQTDEKTAVGDKTIDYWSQHCADLLNLNASDIEDFAQWSAEITDHLQVTKIAEASFGEVFRLSVKPCSSEDTSAAIPYHEESVLKIIALTPPDATLPRNKRNKARVLKKTAIMSKPDDVASEAKLLQRMSSIPGFTNFRDMRVLKGRPSAPFIGAYKAYNRAQKAASKELSHFPNPALKTSYSDDQLWAVIEMQDAGTDLERLLDRHQDTSVWSTWDIFWRTTLALAKGEESAEFEHRDLHLGNICVQGDDLDKCKQQDVDHDKKLGFTGAEVTLIDYTISRASLHSDPPQIAYFDLANDEHIFNGDSSDEYQYEIYRYMRSALFSDDAMASYTRALPRRTWSQFHPQTNIVWLHYILHKLLEKMSPPSARPAQSKKTNKSAADAQWKREKELGNVLKSTRELLDPAVMIKNGLQSASGLVTIALNQKWLDLEDVIGGDVTGIDDDLAGGLSSMTLRG